MASGTITKVNRAITKTASSYVTKFSGRLVDNVATISVTVDDIPSNTFTHIGTLDVKPYDDLVFPAVGTSANGVGIVLISKNGAIQIYSALPSLQFAFTFVTN